MANEEQLSILKQGVEVWNKWREDNPDVDIDLSGSDLNSEVLTGVNFFGAILDGANFAEAFLDGTDLRRAQLIGTNFGAAKLTGSDFTEAKIVFTSFFGAQLAGANLHYVNLGSLMLGGNDLSQTLGLEKVHHYYPSSVGIDTIQESKGLIPEVFLRGCGLSDLQIEYSKLFNPDLSNDEVNRILYRMYDLRATQALQISPLFISYSHANSSFVDKIETHLNKKGIRFWRDIHELKAGRIETQIDQAITQNRTILLVLSEHSLKSDWVEHEVRKARDIAKDTGRDTLCPVALDDSWKKSSWPKRVMEQIMEYNILDFSAWEDDSKFDGMFRKLIDGLELFYKG